MEQVIWFFIGVAAGIAWYRFLIIYMIGRNPCTKCDYCSFEIQKRQIFKKK